MEEFRDLPRRRKTISIPREKKLFWIGGHLQHFEIVDQTYKHPKMNNVAKRLVNVIRSDFDYSYKTIDCDLVWTWLQLYREHKLELKNQNKMSNSFNHETLKERIKSVFSNGAYEDQWDILMEMFPEIYQEWTNEKWDRQYTIGHVYMRREQSSNRVVSLLMPVRLQAQDRPGLVVIKILNLITGSFWEPFVVIKREIKFLTLEQWTKLTRNITGENFTHLGQFTHNHHNAYIQGEHEPFLLHTQNES